MLSDALFESVERLDHYLADPDWRSDYDPATLARADAIRAAMDALRGMLDAYPSTGDAIETAISGDIGPLDTRIARIAEWGRQDTPPNLRFNPRDFREWAVAAIKLIQVIDQHIVPLLPELRPLVTKPMNHQPSPDSSILGVLCDHHTTAHNPMPLADVARLSGLDQPTFEATLEHLMRQGLVSRHATIGAAPSIGLTEFGQRLC